MPKQAILLINLGTPNSASKKEVKAYLQEFLMDPRVIQIPKLIRGILVYGFITPFRSKRSAHAYQTIWTQQGSPLKLNTENLVKKLRQKMNIPIFYAMRYGHPQIAHTLTQLKDYEEIIVLPLYPQYASATTGSSFETIFDYYKTSQVVPSLKLIRDFYQRPEFIQALATSIQKELPPNHHLLLSYHGLPEKQLKAIGCRPICPSPCTQAQNPACYRYQCYATSNALAQCLNLQTKDYSVSFQSRLGKTPWIKPYTDETLKRLAATGIKNLSIACPSFIADCLETLEEIGLQAKTQWQQLGGEEFKLIPCLNDQAIWVEALAKILTTL